MIDRRLLSIVGDSRVFIVFGVLSRWLSLLSQITATFAIGRLLDSLRRGERDLAILATSVGVVSLAMLFRLVFDLFDSYCAFRASRDIKRSLRDRIFAKLLRLGAGYRTSTATAEIVQVASEGVDQLEVYFSRYLPQFFYALFAPLTLFIAFSMISFQTALVLFLCVPLIPVLIVVITRFAKRVFAKYWGIYIGLGDSFLENLQGLTTLKIYRADECRHAVMDQRAETFRQITMKVLVLQLSSIVVMDLVAYGGAALGIAMALLDFRRGVTRFGGAIEIILLSAEFFIPMRTLGSFFHVAMNGVSAGKRMFAFLDTPEPAPATLEIDDSDLTVSFSGVGFCYESGQPVLNSVSFRVEPRKLTAVVGESGSGKSTVGNLISGSVKGYSGSIRIGMCEVSQFSDESLVSHVATVGDRSHIFKGTIRSNLAIAKPNATDEELWDGLSACNLREFAEAQDGLETQIAEGAANLSGGQRQRLALARALLADRPIYVFDEATSNVDAESEQAILAVIYRLSESKTVLLISHRLANVARSDQIVVLERGAVAESGTHAQLMENASAYALLFTTQADLERRNEPTASP
jgi:ATP-binding cassette subfamily C protein